MFQRLREAKKGWTDPGVTLAETSALFSALVGESVVAAIPGLGPGGMISNSVAGVMNTKRDERSATLGATDVRKGVLGLLVVTATGRLAVYRMKAKRSGIELIDEVASWTPGEAAVAMRSGKTLALPGTVVTIEIAARTGERYVFESLATPGTMPIHHQPFAATLGLTLT